MLQTLLKRPALTALAFGLLPLAQVLWESAHGGVARHHILNREDLPAISNWWAVLSTPVLALLVLSLVRRRTQHDVSGEQKGVVLGFLGGLGFGILLASFWEMHLEAYMPYLLLVPLVLAFFLPTYRPECLLGFVLAMTWTFGGVLPIGIGLILLSAAWIVHQGIRGGVLRLLGR